MNCIHAQAMLAAYRDLDESEKLELDAHLEECVSCRHLFADFTSVGEQVRSLPAIEPAPDMFAKLMRVLATEHTQYLQQAQSSTVPPLPEFLKPYLPQPVQSTPANVPDSLVAFSSAETGPLPIIRLASKRRQKSPMRQFAVIGLVATLLMVVMMGALTSLLLLTHADPQGVSSSVGQFSNVQSVTYATNTPYQHIVSAVGDSKYIYYTAYKDELHPAWMLEQMDRATKVSIPLLFTPTDSTLVVLGSSNGWLIYLQLDALQSAHSSVIHDDYNGAWRTWKLYAYPLTTMQQGTLPVYDPSQLIVSGTFDENLVPDWVYTPVQGIWFEQNALLIAMIDSKGFSHLYQYQFGLTSDTALTEIAHAAPGHILTSPTANSDGSSIFWGEEWTDNGILKGNIWTQQLQDIQSSIHGVIRDITQATQSPYRTDGTSFEPMVVNQTLFFLDTLDLNASSQGVANSLTPTATPQPNTSPLPRVDLHAFTPALDSTIRGNLYSVPSDFALVEPPTKINVGLISNLQQGTGFLFWESDDGGYGMLEVVNSNIRNVTVGNVLENANFLSVNNGTAVWTLNVANSATSPNNTGTLVTLKAFDWPNKP